jgi:hypothetical protein
MSLATIFKDLELLGPMVETDTRYQEGPQSSWAGFATESSTRVSEGDRWHIGVRGACELASSPYYAARSSRVQSTGRKVNGCMRDSALQVCIRVLAFGEWRLCRMWTRRGRGAERNIPPIIARLVSTLRLNWLCRCFSPSHLSSLMHPA